MGFPVFRSLTDRELRDVSELIALVESVRFIGLLQDRRDLVLESFYTFLISDSSAARFAFIALFGSLKSPLRFRSFVRY